ncbi:MAG: TolC family protein [Aliarcobacter sp.]|nr:TolC family protein [Aliarcobacter sp.]
MKIKKITYSLSALAFLMTSLQATSLKDVVEHTIQNNQDIVSKSLNNDAYRKYIDEQKGGYYPKIDLTTYLGVVDEKETRKGLPSEDTNYKGGNAQVDLEQLLYDGNLTPSLVEEAKARYSSNKLKNSNDVENILFDSISSYLNILKFDERILISKDNLSIHEDYMGIATQTEKINGEILDKVQTKAKIHSAKSSLFAEQNSKNAAQSAFSKNVGMKIEGSICRPVLDESKIPMNLDTLHKSVLENNYQILEQIENIKEQRAIISKEKAGFLPTLKIKLQGIYDKDLLDKDLKTNTYSGKLELRYNIFNGMVNDSRTEREELFLKEAQAKLDTVSKSVLDEVTVAYETYQTSKKQIEELKQFIEENKQIIDIYKDQFDAGTRNFIDVLNVEGDLYNSKISLINTEYAMYTAYYELLKATSTLQTTIANSAAQSCGVSTAALKSTETSVQELLSEDTKESVVAKESTITDEYALFLASVKDSATADKTLQNVSTSLEKNTKAKKVQNSNGTYSVVVYNIDGLQEAISLKTKYNSKYPTAYYIKKKK